MNFYLPYLLPGYREVGLFLVLVGSRPPPPPIFLFPYSSYGYCSYPVVGNNSSYQSRMQLDYSSVNKFTCFLSTFGLPFHRSCTTKYDLVCNNKGPFVYFNFPKKILFLLFEFWGPMLKATDVALSVQSSNFLHNFVSYQTPLLIMPMSICNTCY